MRPWLIALSAAGLFHGALALTVAASYAPLRPLLECVDSLPDGSFIAHFGVLNRSTSPLVQPIGEANTFEGSAADRGQPTHFSPGRTRPYPRAIFKVASAGDTLRWKLGEQVVEAAWGSRPCQPDIERFDRPEPKLQPIKPVVDEPPPEVIVPPVEPSEAPPKKEQATKLEASPAAKPAPKRPRKRRRKKRPVRTAEPPPLIVSSAGEFGDIKVRGGTHDSFGGSAGTGALTRVLAVSEPPPVVEAGPVKGTPPVRVAARVLNARSARGRYPTEAEGLGRYVEVVLSVRVSANGKVTKVKVVGSGGPAFDREAKRVGFSLRWKPATLDGAPYATWNRWEVKFLPPQ